MKNSHILRSRIAQARLAKPLTLHPRFDDLYPEYLFRTYCIAESSVPLMQAALAELELFTQPRQLTRAFSSYLTRHIKEEARHDQWLLEDLQVLGHEPAQIRARPAPLSIARGVGAQYYWIRHAHPVALLGYMAVLEGSFPGQSTIEETIHHSRHPRQAFRTFLYHAKLDPEHSQEVFELLDRLPLKEDLLRLLDTSFLATLTLLSDNARELLRGLKGRRAAADPGQQLLD